MAFDQGLAQRIREHLTPTGGLAEKQMFGGLAFLVDGNMCVGVIGEELMARVGLDATDTARELPCSLLFDPSGRQMYGLTPLDSPPLEARPTRSASTQGAHLRLH